MSSGKSAQRVRTLINVLGDLWFEVTFGVHTYVMSCHVLLCSRFIEPSALPHTARAKEALGRF